MGPRRLENRTYLGQSELVTAPEERTLALSISKERFNFLHDAGNQFLRLSIAVCLRGGPDIGSEVRDNLAEECIDEESQAGTVQRVICRAGRRQELRRVCVGKELRDDAGLGDDLAVVREAGNQATLNTESISALFLGGRCVKLDTPLSEAKPVTLLHACELLVCAYIPG